MMDFNFLPAEIERTILDGNSDKISEIRFRLNFPVFGIINGKRLFFSKNGKFTFNKKDALICTSVYISEILDKVTEKSLYAYNDRIKQGFITTKDGIRIGIAGECVFDGNNIVTIKNFTSLNIRIPHIVKNCSSAFFNKIYSDRVYNTLIVSPPSKGKTTILKDIADKLNEWTSFSILLIDERGEFCSVKGENIDTIRFCDKRYALNYAIRSLSPEIVITDELQTENDWKCAKSAVLGGVKMIATCHGDDILSFRQKEFFDESIFERYIVLENCTLPGVLKGVYDKGFNEL